MLYKGHQKIQFFFVLHSSKVIQLFPIKIHWICFGGVQIVYFRRHFLQHSIQENFNCIFFGIPAFHECQISDFYQVPPIMKGITFLILIIFKGKSQLEKTVLFIFLSESPLKMMNFKTKNK